MKHFYKLLFLGLVVSNLAFAQGNLVPNWSFEDTTHCPTETDGLNAASNWFSARATPDYFHPCANMASSIVGVPDNFAGYQNPLTGLAYAGILSYNRLNQGYREHIQVKLLENLHPGTQYFVSAYFSRGDSTSSGEVFDCSTNRLGFRFSNTKYDASIFDYSPIDNFAHVYSTNILEDSLNWVQISGYFIADSAYAYLLIGNFFEESNMTITQCSGTAYYYLDNVCVSTDSGTCDVSVSTPELHKNLEIKIYPNPATDVLMLTNLSQEYTYSIFNSSGIFKTQGKVSEAKNTINIKDLASGLFFLRLNNTYTYKFFISH